MDSGRQDRLADLRLRIARLEGGSRKTQPLPFGLTDMDECLPGGGLARGVLHELIEAGLACEFAGCTTLFAAGVAARLKGPVLWRLARRDLFAPGLLRAGLHPDRVIYAEAEREILPLIEEGLREKGLAAAVGEVSRLGLTASRRLQVAAEAAGVTALIIRRWWTVAEKDLVHCPTAAVTRWRIAPAPSQLMPAPGLGRDRWQVELLRCRGAAPVPGSWRLAMRRVVSLYLPTWLTDRIRRRTGEPPRHEPLVTVHTIGSRRLIRSACAAAQELGLHPGMTLAQAQALVPNLHVAEAIPDEDDASLRELAHWAIGYSPMAAPDSPDGLWIDIAGVSHLFGSEEELLRDLTSRLTWLLRLLARNDMWVVIPGVGIIRLRARMYAEPSLRNFHLAHPGANKLKTGEDLLIVAGAIVEHAVVVTFNVADFMRIGQAFALPGLYDPGADVWPIAPRSKLTIRNDRSGRPPSGPTERLPKHRRSGPHWSRMVVSS